MHTRLRKTGSNALKAFDPVFVSSVNQGKRSFPGGSDRQPRLPPCRTAARRLRPPLRPPFSLPKNSEGLSGQQELGQRTGEGAVRLRCALQTEKQGKRSLKASAASSAPFAGTKGAESPGGDPASRFAAGPSKKRQKLSRLTGRGGRIGPPLPVRRY